MTPEGSQTHMPSLVSSAASAGYAPFALEPSQSRDLPGSSLGSFKAGDGGAYRLALRKWAASAGSNADTSDVQDAMRLEHERILSWRELRKRLRAAGWTKREIKAEIERIQNDDESGM